ncbi:MAG: glutaredoxin family protein [Candidatus Nitrospinota bacterium M3_3B_026]
MTVLNFYTASWCPDCAAAKRVLDERGLDYNLVDIDETPEAVDTIIAARGKRVVPTLEYGGRYMDGNRFNREKFEKELDELFWG